MKKYLYDYIKYIDEVIKEKKYNEEIIKEHLIKIQFFQHERFIHLCVTLTYALLFIISMVATFTSVLFCFIGLIFAGFLVPYVIHYFRLENGVQYLYKQYDMMKGNK